MAAINKCEIEFMFGIYYTGNIIIYFNLNLNV